MHFPIQYKNIPTVDIMDFPPRIRLVVGRTKLDPIPEETTDQPSTPTTQNVKQVEPPAPKKPKKKPKKKRCAHSDCRTRLKLTDVECRCKKRYCGKHRMPEVHECIIPPKDHAKAINLPCIRPKKIDLL